MKKRQLILVGDELGQTKDTRPGDGAAVVDGRIIAVQTGFLQRSRDRVGVIPMNGAYEPSPGDTVIGIVTEANTSNWIVDIRAPWPAPMHVSEAPWRVDFGETTQYLRAGDVILCKVLFVDDSKKLQVTLKDRNLTKLEEGELLEIPPIKVARVIGRNGSMLNLIKEYLECWLYVGRNGRVWLNGDPHEVQLGKQVIQMIAKEAHLPGLTDRVRAMLEAFKPGGIDAEFATERTDSEEE